jgi:multimeric flavodoxin WrbA
MNIILLNGNPDPNQEGFDRYLDAYRVKLHKTGHYVRSFRLRDMNLRTTDPDEPEFLPEKNKHTMIDDFQYIMNALPEMDLLVLASTHDHGEFSTWLKMLQERFTSFAGHPDKNQPIWTEGEYTTFQMPLAGLITCENPGSDSRESLLTRLAAERFAANLNTILSFSINTNYSVTEAVCKTFQSLDYRRFIESTCNDLLTGSGC